MPRCLYNNGGGCCTDHGTLTNNLGLCKPMKGELDWLPAINCNADLISGMFNSTSCTLNTGYGGTGSALSPLPGDLLIGDPLNDGTYTRLPIDLGGMVLGAGSASGYRMQWQFPVAESCADVGTCTALVYTRNNTCRAGEMVVDATLNRVWMCFPPAGWQWADLSD